MSRFLATPASAASPLADALRISPYFDHLDGKNVPQGYKAAPAIDGQTFHIWDKEVQKSELDDRQYRLIRLENGMEALLVSDSTTDKAAASLCVRVGHLSDPVCVVLLSRISVDLCCRRNCKDLHTSANISSSWAPKRQVS